MSLLSLRQMIGAWSSSRRYAEGKSTLSVWTVPADRAAEAVEILTRVFPTFPGSDALDQDEGHRVATLIHARSVESTLAIGRLDAWGDPMLGVALWLRRPAIGEPEPRRAARTSIRASLPPEVLQPLRRFDEVMQRLRSLSRPDRHVYLDMLGVLPDHRRLGIATRLLEVGHAWADALGLPCALDTDTDENVAFYERRGYVAIARERLPDSDHDLVAMRRRAPARDRRGR